MLFHSVAPGYYGCVREAFGSSYRLLPDHPVDEDDPQREPRWVDNDMTIQKCINRCRQLDGDIRYAGLQSNRECFCGTTDRENSLSVYRLDDSECNFLCAGDRSTICGGNFKLSVYDSKLNLKFI